MRIGIVNDLLLAREALRRVVTSVPGYQVAWVADDGAAAVRLARADRPDVILMDLIMPVMDGVEATRQIMTSSPCPILLVTSSVTGNFHMVLQALGYGGLDAVNTPILGSDGQIRDSNELLARLARLNQSHAHVTPLPMPVASPGRPSIRDTTTCPPALALGASTGGPVALGRIDEALPSNFPCPVIIIQHISAEFAPNLVVWLQSRSALTVEIARDHAMPAVGKVHVAVTNDHLVVRPGGRFHYTADPVDYPFRPSIDAFFATLAAHWPRPGVAALLTGMGNDGARGLLALQKAGWLTMAQDEASCVVYGMPRAAVELNAARRVLPLSEIPGAILARLANSQRGSPTS